MFIPNCGNKIVDGLVTTDERIIGASGIGYNGIIHQVPEGTNNED